MGERMGGGHEHLVGHQSCSARDRAKTDAGEDVGIVTLPRHEGLAVEFYRIVWAAACEQRAALSMAVGFLRGAFRLLGWGVQRQHHRSIADSRHALKYPPRESAAPSRDARARARVPCLH